MPKEWVLTLGPPEEEEKYKVSLGPPESLPKKIARGYGPHSYLPKVFSDENLENWSSGVSSDPALRGLGVGLTYLTNLPREMLSLLEFGGKQGREIKTIMDSLYEKDPDKYEFLKDSMKKAVPAATTLKDLIPERYEGWDYTPEEFESLSFINKLGYEAASTPGIVSKYILGTAAAGGNPVVGMAMVDMAQAADEGGTAKEIGIAGARGAMLGKVLSMLHPVKSLLKRALLTGGIFGGQAYTETGDPWAAFRSGLVGVGLGSMHGPAKPENVMRDTIRREMASKTPAERAKINQEFNKELNRLKPLDEELGTYDRPYKGPTELEAFAKKNIPLLEKRIGEYQTSLWDTQTFADSQFYDGTFPIPRDGGIVGAKYTNKYRTDPVYREKVDRAIKDVTEHIIDANKKLGILEGRTSSGVFGVDYMVTERTPEKVRAGYRVDASRAWHMEAKKKYPGARYLGDIAVREGLQNSLDAVIEAKEKGHLTRGKIDIETDYHRYVLEDNGIGMSDTDIAEKFLTLHATGKDVQGRFGGFGIAGAVEVGPSESAWWELHTRDNYFNHDMAKAEDFIQSAEPRVGTKLSVKADETIVTEDARKYVEITEVPDWVDVTYNGETLQNPFKGLRSKKEKGKTDDGLTDYTLSYYPKAPEGYEKKFIIRLVDTKTKSKLAQAINNIWNEGFHGTIIADLKTRATPGDLEYPLTDSRMDFKWDFRRTTDPMIEKHSVDPSSARRAGIESRWYKVFDRTEWKDTFTKLATDESYQKLYKLITEEYQIPVTPLEQMELKVDKGFKGYKGGSLFHAKHLLAYEAVAKMSAELTGAPVNKFYGLLSLPVEGKSVASEYGAGAGSLGLNFLLVDKTSLKSPLHYAMYLKGLTDHELTHNWFGKHDQEFSTMRDTLHLRTTPSFLRVLRIAEEALGKAPELVEPGRVPKGPRAPTQPPSEPKVIRETVKEFVNRTIPTEQLKLDMSLEPRGAVDDKLYYPRPPERGPQLGLFERPAPGRPAGPSRPPEPTRPGRGPEQSRPQEPPETEPRRVDPGPGERPSRNVAEWEQRFREVARNVLSEEEMPPLTGKEAKIIDKKGDEGIIEVARKRGFTEREIDDMLLMEELANEGLERFDVDPDRMDHIHAEERAPLELRDEVKGKPVIGYHATTSDRPLEREFGTHLPGRKKFYPGDVGAWFSVDRKGTGGREAAEEFGRQQSERSGKPAEVMELELDIKNPKVYLDYESFLEENKRYRSGIALQKKLRKEGYDGIRILESRTDSGVLREDWVAFDRSQVRRPREDPVVDLEEMKDLKDEGKDKEWFGAPSQKIPDYSSDKYKLGECYRNSGKYGMEIEGDVVHGSVYSQIKEKQVNHAWVEKEGKVHDPTINVIVDKDHYYKIMGAKEDARYSRELGEEAAVKAIREGHWGPYDEPKKPTPTYGEAGEYILELGEPITDPAPPPGGNLTPRAMRMPEMVEFITELLEGKVPKVEQKLRAKGARGIFRPAKGEVGLLASIFKDPVGAARTLAHELGHVLSWLPDKYIKRGNLLGHMATLMKHMKGTYGELYKNSEIKDELKKLSQKIKPFDETQDPKYTKYRYSSPELYADAISVLFNDPALLYRDAPKFYDGFFRYMYRKPKARDLYNEILERMEDEIGLLEHRRSRRWSAYDEPDNVASANKSVKGFMEKVSEGLIDQYDAIYKLEKKAKKFTEIDPQDSPILALEQALYKGSYMKQYIQDTGIRVYQPLIDAKIDMRFFSDWLLFDRIINERGEVANPGGQTVESAKLEMADMKRILGPEGFKKLEESAKNYRQIRKDLIIPLIKEAKLYGKELMEFIEANDHYSTFDVITGKLQQKYGGGHTAYIHRQYGTLKHIRDPFAKTILKDMAMVRAAFDKRGITTTSDFLRKNFPGTVRNSVREPRTVGGRTFMVPKDTRDAGWGTVKVLHEGKIVGIDMPERVARSLNRNPQEADLVWRALRTFNIPFKNMFVERNPGFWAFNLWRDYYRSISNIPGGHFSSVGPRWFPAVKFTKEYIKALKPAYRDAFGIPDSVIREMNLKNMLISMETWRGETSEARAADRMLARWQEKPTTWTGKVMKPFQVFWDAWGALGQMTERPSKIAAYQYLKKYTNLTDAEIRPIVHRDVGSPSFLRKGTGYDIYNNLFIFSNAIKEGWRADIQALKQRPLEIGYKRAKYAIPKWGTLAGGNVAFANAMWRIAEHLLPKMTQIAAEMGLLGPVNEETMKKATSHMLSNYVVVPLGETPSGKGVFLTIPQDETMRFFGGVLYKLFKAGKLGNVFELTDYISGQAPSLSPSLSLFADLTQYLVGKNPYDPFYGRLAVDERVFEAGGWRSQKAFMKYMFEKYGGRVVYRFGVEDVEGVSTELEGILGLPIASNVIGRFIRVTDAGLKEELKEWAREPRREALGRQLDLRDNIIDHINSFTKKGQKPPRTKIRSFYQEQKKSGLIPRTKSFSQFENQYKRYLVRSKENPYIERIVQTQSNEEKIKILKKYKEELSPSMYRNIELALRREGFISSKVLRDVRRKRAP